jgi:4-hydroxybenzoate polyprenyltransferase
LASFGWALCHKLGVNRPSTLLLWFAGALLVYNCDRFRPERADSRNTPLRSAWCERLRGASLALILLSGASLVLIPAFLGEWRILALVLAGALFSLAYSLRIFGFRFKDIPVVKTFFVPTVIAAAYLAIPLLKAQFPLNPARLLLGVSWAWCLLFFNMLLCDLRDLEGDRAAGVVTLPVYLGPERTRRVLMVVGVCAPGLAWGLHWPWQALASGTWEAFTPRSARPARNPSTSGGWRACSSCPPSSRP